MNKKIKVLENKKSKTKKSGETFNRQDTNIVNFIRNKINKTRGACNKCVWNLEQDGKLFCRVTSNAKPKEVKGLCSIIRDGKYKFSKRT